MAAKRLLHGSNKRHGFPAVIYAYIYHGTGKLYAKKDGTVFFFCSAKCENNVALGRVTRRIKWARKGA